MKKDTKLIIVFPIIVVLCGALLGFLVKDRLNNNITEKNDENGNIIFKGDFKHGEEKFIKEYDILCDNGNHIESFYHDPSGSDMVPMEEFYTLDIYCVDKNGIKNGIYYKFGGDTPIEKGYFLNGQMDGERNLYFYDEVVNYKNGVRAQESGYYSDGVLRYTGGYIDDGNVRQETFYHKNGNISTIRTYSGDDLIERREFYEDGKIEYECIDGGACIDYDESGKITRKVPNNYRGNYSGEEIWTYPNGQLKKLAYYINGKYDGKYTEYYENGQVSYACNYASGQKEWCITYSEDGEIKHETRYYKGTACSKKVYDDWKGKDFGIGSYTGYYENGKISFTCNYISTGQEEGKCVNYERNGEIKEEHRHHKGYVYSKTAYDNIIAQENLLGNK